MLENAIRHLLGHLKRHSLTLNLPMLRCQSADMIAKELILAITGYHLVRAVMNVATQQNGLNPRRRSFSRSQDVVNAALPGVDAASSPEEYQVRLQRMLRLVASCKLPDRRRRATTPRQSLDHPAVADEDNFFDGELLSQGIDLFGHGGRIGGVAAEHAHRQRLSRRIGEQPNDDLPFAFFPVPVIAKLAQRVVFAFPIGTGDVVEKQGGSRAVALEIPAKESLVDFLLAGAEIVQSVVKIFFVELAQTEHFSDGVIASPTNGRQTRTLMANAGQDQEPGEFAKFGLAEGGGKTAVVCHLFEGVKETEDRPGGA